MSSSGGERMPGFLRVDRGAALRLAVTLLVGVCALAGPRVAHTGAEFSDSVDLPATFRTAPTFGPTPVPTAAPSSAPTAEPTPAPTLDPSPEPSAGPTPRPSAGPDGPGGGQGDDES